MSRKLIVSAVSAVSAVALAGVTLVAPVAEAAPARGVTNVHASSKHTVTIARTIRPGVVHLRNTGSRAVFLFGRKKAGATDLAKYLNADSDKTAKKAFTKFDFVEIVLPHADDYLSLKRGTYYLGDASADTVKASKIRSLTVTGKTSNAKRPAALGVTMSGKGRLQVSSSGSARTHLRILNKSSAPVYLEVIAVRKDATAADVKAFLAKPSYDGLAKIADQSRLGEGDVAFVGPRRDITVGHGLRPGRYVAETFNPFGSFAISRNTVSALNVH